jgi:hypothetical protein
MQPVAQCCLKLGSQEEEELSKLPMNNHSLPPPLDDEG